MLIDTHCHIHESYDLPRDEVLARAKQQGISDLICVGTSEESSRLALAFSAEHPEAYAAIGVHPHDTKDGYSEIAAMASADAPEGHKLVAIGEIGLDYYYGHSPKETQIAALEAQIEVALAHNLPVIFHVRDAFDDFWPIFETYEARGLRGVLHSFTDTLENMQKAINKGLCIGVNGISTFTKDPEQQAMFDAIPLEHIVFETDAPFLTPVPNRGKINEPAYVRLVAEYHAARRGISLEEIAAASSRNARALFRLG